MTALIPKRAGSRATARTPAFFYESARDGMRDLLRNATTKADSDGVLLPDYIGWSPREGSGVLDPVRNSGRNMGFYRVNNDLTVDVESLRALLAAGGYQFVVVVAYFGRTDPRIPEVRDLADSVGAMVIEDLAHGFFSAVRAPEARKFCHAAVYSLHKQFPVDSGGMVVYREPGLVTSQYSTRPDLAGEILSYDWTEISERRRQNFRELSSALAQLPSFEKNFKLLWHDLSESDVPQSLPVVVRGLDRDRIYKEMNADGIGMVSLYHTLDSVLPADDSVAAGISLSIINFPVHQDVLEEAIPAIVGSFADAIARQSSGSGV